MNIISANSRKLFHFTSLDKDDVFFKLAYPLYQSWSSMKVPCFNKVGVRRHTAYIPHTRHTKLVVLCSGPRRSYITGYLESLPSISTFYMKETKWPFTRQLFFYLSVLVYLSQVVTGKNRSRLFIAVNLSLWLIYISMVLYTCIFNIMEENKNNHGQKVPTVCYLKKIFFSVFFIVNKPHFSKVFWRFLSDLKKKRTKSKKDGSWKMLID